MGGSYLKNKAIGKGMCSHFFFPFVRETETLPSREAWDQALPAPVPIITFYLWKDGGILWIGLWEQHEVCFTFGVLVSSGNHLETPL